jgi:LCP family protein required for cell wall assembly
MSVSAAPRPVDAPAAFAPAPRSPDYLEAGRRFLRFPEVVRAAPPRQPVRARRPSPAGAAVRSALIPGWGQWAVGRRRRGLLLTVLATVALVVPLLALLSVVSPLLVLLPLPLPAAVREGLTVLERAFAFAVAGAGTLSLPLPAGGRLDLTSWTTLAWTILGLNVVALAFRALVALDAAATARAAGRSVSRTGRTSASRHWIGRLASAGLAAGAVTLVAGPHLAVAGAAAIARPLFVQLLPVAVPVPDGGPSGAIVPGQPLLLGQPAPPAAPPPDPFVAALEALPADTGRPNRPAWDGVSPLNVLLLGTDQRPSETAIQRWGNSDTIILVSVDPAQQRAAMVSIPRDVLVSIPGVGEQKVNAAYLRGGPQLAMRVVGDLVGLPVHRWASVDTSAFAAVVDAIGGVVVDVDTPIRDDDYPTDDYGVRRIMLPAGLQWLDGERALWYARSRHASNDYDRAGRQQRLLRALQGRARDPSLLPRVPTLLGVVAGAVQTDVSPREAVVLARLAAGAAAGASGANGELKAVRGIVLTPPEYGRELVRPDLYAVIPDRARIRQAISTLLSEAPPET